MSPKSWLPGRTLRRNSWSFSTRPSISWFATQNWLDRAEMHRNGQVGTRGSLLPSIQRGIRDFNDSGISHWTNRVRMHRWDFDQTSEQQWQAKTVSTENQAKNVQNPFFFNNIKDGTLLPQVIPGGSGTRPKAGGAHEFNSCFFLIVCCSRFRW